MKSTWFCEFLGVIDTQNFKCFQQVKIEFHLIGLINESENDFVEKLYDHEIFFDIVG